MRAITAGVGSVDALTRALHDELPEVDLARLRGAIERSLAKVANAVLDTEGHAVVDLHLQRVEATEESTERAEILRQLSETLEQRKDADRALVVRLSAFVEAAIVGDVDPLLRLARVTGRWRELPLDAMTALAGADPSAPRLSELAHAWQQVGRAYYAADCFERVLVLAPADLPAYEALELFYRSTSEWPVLVDLLERRAVHVDDRERAELYREIAVIYERELGDDGGALDANREADRLAPGHKDVLEALARLYRKTGATDEEFEVLERWARTISEPIARARVICRAADLARLADYDKAQVLYDRARADDPDLVAAIDGLVGLHRDRGMLVEAVELLVAAADRPALAAERSRWLADAADFGVALGDVARAKGLYREARVADPTNHRAGVALVELCWEAGALVELAPILDELCRTTEDPGRLRGYLLQRGQVAAQLGDTTGARQALALAVDLDPHDHATRSELAAQLFEVRAWAKARPLIEGLLDREDLLPPGEGIELHARLARCAYELGDRVVAADQIGITLALAPDHHAALTLKSELDSADPLALAADQLALANLAPAEEKGARFTALGDRYTELGDAGTAREMYREALIYKPGDHPLLTKYLGLVAADGDWSYSLDIVERLIDTEKDAAVRARYRHLAGMIARDELGNREQATQLLELAIEDDPRSFAIADELEALLASDREALARFYYRRLEHVRELEGRSGERLRLWDALGELCKTLGRVDDAVSSFEVALSLAPSDNARRERLADLYLEAGPIHAANAIAHHQAVLRADKRRAQSYQALRTLYRRNNQPAKAQACDEALAIITALAAGHVPAPVIGERIDELFESSPMHPTRVRGDIRDRPFAAEDWMAMARLGVDPQLSALFALVAPAFAIDRAKLRPPLAVPGKEHEPKSAVARVLGRILAAFGVPRPPIYADRDQPAPGRVMLRAREGMLVSVLVLGRPALEAVIDDHELAFGLARELADLRTDRLARLLCPRASELAQIVELAQAGDATSHGARWLATALHPAEHHQALAIGARLGARGVHALGAAREWLVATERAADRIGLAITGELATCVRVLERAREPTNDRIVDLVWASVTEELLGLAQPA